jgi:hypothetical protein
MKKPFVLWTIVGLPLNVTFNSFSNINIYGRNVQDTADLKSAPDAD